MGGFLRYIAKTQKTFRGFDCESDILLTTGAKLKMNNGNNSDISQT